MWYYINIRKEETLMSKRKHKKSQKLEDFTIATASGIVSGVVSGIIVWLLTK